MKILPAHPTLLKVAKACKPGSQNIAKYLKASKGTLWATNGHSIYRMRSHEDDVKLEGLVKVSTVPPKVNDPVDIPLEDLPGTCYPDTEGVWDGYREDAKQFINFSASELYLLVKVLRGLKLKGTDTVQIRWGNKDDTPIFVRCSENSDFEGAIMPQTHEDF